MHTIDHCQAHSQGRRDELLAHAQTYRIGRRRARRRRQEIDPPRHTALRKWVTSGTLADVATEPTAAR